MRKQIIALLAAVLSCTAVAAQLNENFNDGDFTNNPTWVGGTSDFVVNSSRLQSNNLVANSTYYLSTPNTKATQAQWDIVVQLDFNPSSANYVDIFLVASASDLTQASTTGYFVRLGGTDDEISLFRKDGAASVKIIDGINGSLNSSVNLVQLTVARDAANQWQITRTINGAIPITEPTATDATYLTSAFFGLLIKQSTASFFQKHFFDEIIIGDFVADIIPPFVVTYTVTSNSSVDILFSEPVALNSSQTLSNYVVSNGIGTPLTATRDAANPALVHLTFATNFPANTSLQITVNGVADLAGNIATGISGNFSYAIAQQYAVVIDEIMADPDPQVSLPNLEWLELRNTTGGDLNLQNWRLGKPSGESGPMPSYTLKADSFVIVCTGSAVAALSAYGPVISVTSFPSLGNAGDLLYLKSSTGQVIHSVNYSDAWYQNVLKKDGGWSLEMIDSRNPCSGINNWAASTDPAGGTPGRKNSVDAVNPDDKSPGLVRAFALNATTAIITFDEPVDSSAASIAGNYSVSDGIGTALTATPIGPVFDKVQLTFTNSFQPNLVYTLTVGSAVIDCSGNAVSARNTAKLGLASSSIDSFDIVINEILFNPTSASNDYIEIYNRSNKILNLKNLSLANATGFERVTADDFAFFPGDFMVLTESKALVLQVYVANNPDAFIEMQMPSFNDDAGDVRLLNEQGNIVDRVVYLDDWQFALISNDEGVALERIDYNAASQNAENWHSASSTVNYGTPTYKNSQFRVGADVQGTITIEPEIFSPDNDGRDDFTTINYSFPEPGYVANITVFDAVGRRVKNLQRNALNGIKGSYRWDGLDEKNQKLPAGIYIIYTEVFNLQGKTKKYKNTVVLAKRH